MKGVLVYHTNTMKLVYLCPKYHIALGTVQRSSGALYDRLKGASMKVKLSELRYVDNFNSLMFITLQLVNYFHSEHLISSGNHSSRTAPTHSGVPTPTYTCFL